MNVLYGKPVAEKIRSELAEKIALLGRAPTIAAVGFSDNPQWVQYAESMKKSAINYGCRVETLYFTDGVESLELFQQLDRLGVDETIDGIIVQQPLPQQYRYAINHVNPDKDIDGLTARNLQSTFCNKETLVPATPLAVVRMLEYYGIDLCGKDVVILGRGVSVGKPLMLMMLNRNATVTVCHTRSQNLAEIASRADVVIAACGSPHLVNANFVKKGAVVIDVGLSFVDGKTVGDVDFEEVSQIATVSPVPGGIGPVTRACLFENTVGVALRRNK